MENPKTMNFDLNLIPNSNPSDGGESYPIAALNFENWLGSPAFQYFTENVTSRARSSWRRPPSILELTLGGSTGECSLVGEDSLVGEETRTGMYKNGNGSVEDKARGKKVDHGKSIDDESNSFFDCNICFDLAKEPVVTRCGHLFCWRCLYRWVHHHSCGNECPVCKGEVDLERVTPIYGRGGNEVESNLDSIPPRPHARRGESKSSTQGATQSVMLNWDQLLGNDVELDFGGTSIGDFDIEDFMKDFGAEDFTPSRRRRLN